MPLRRTGEVDEIAGTSNVEGVISVTMAYAVLITLILVGPLIRLVSVAMKASEKRR